MTPDIPNEILRDEASEALKSGIWGVRNYYTTLEQRAIAGATMSGGYLAMVVAATIMATAGLLINSSAAIIGSMCVAPFIAPSRAVCIGAIFHNWNVFFNGLVKQLVGLLVIGVSVSTIVTLILKMNFPTVAITSEILLRAMPTDRDVALSMLIAVSAGAAASLALITEPRIVESPWGQVIDAIIGVEIAISLIPPAAVIGIGWALDSPVHSRNAFYLLLLNVTSLDFVGSAAILAVRGIQRRHLDLEKNIRRIVAMTLHVVPGFTSVGSTVNVTLQGNHEVLVDVVLRRRYGGEAPEHLAENIAADILAKTSCRSDVTVEIIPLLTHNGIIRR